MVKRYLFIICILSMSLTLSAGMKDSKPNFRLTIHLPGIEDSVQIRMMEKENTWSAPSLLIARHGKAKTKFHLSEPVQMVVMGMKFTQNRRSYRPLMFRFVAIPGEHMVISGDVPDITIKGSSIYKEYGRVSQHTDEYKKIAEKDSVRMDYIKSHPYSDVAVMLACELAMDAFYSVDRQIDGERLSARLKSLYQQTKTSFDHRRQRDKANLNMVPGATAPAFTLNDIHGKALSLSSLRGKYVVLDFWGSWCGVCIKGFPKMKEYYEKYKGKFEIIGVDCRDTQQKWKDAVAKYALPWLHVFNPDDSSVTTDYGVQGYPTTVVISPEGKILKTFTGEDPAFYQLLDKLFGL